MNTQEITLQLISTLTRLTNYFSESIVISSLTRVGSVVTCTTTTNHGLITGNRVLVKGSYSPNPISSITRVGNVATATTTTEHDLTEIWYETVKISGATQADYNGDKTLLSVDSAYRFTFTVNNSPVTPATGTIYLNENRLDDFNGVHTITKTGDKTFTYTIAGTPNNFSGSCSAITEIRIWRAIDLETFFKSYTEKNINKLCACVTIGDSQANRARSLPIDSAYIYEAGQDYNQAIVQSVNVYVFIPASSSINGGAQRDLAETIKPFILQSLAGFKPDSGLYEGAKNGLTYQSDGFEYYDGSLYIHRFTFELMYSILIEDIYKDTDTRAFRLFEIDYEHLTNGLDVKEDEGTILF